MEMANSQKLGVGKRDLSPPTISIARHSGDKSLFPTTNSCELVDLLQMAVIGRLHPAAAHPRFIGLTASPQLNYNRSVTSVLTELRHANWFAPLSRSSCVSNRTLTASLTPRG